MNTSASDITLIENLAYAVGKYKLALEGAEKALTDAQANRDTCDDRLSKAQVLLEHERERIGVKQFTLDDGGPYAGLTLKEAVLRVLEKLGGQPATSEEVFDQLRANGYLVESKYPGRSLHAALIGVNQVERVGRATYRWSDGSIDPNDMTPGGSPPRSKSRA